MAVTDLVVEAMVKAGSEKEVAGSVVAVMDLAVVAMVEGG